MRVNSSKLKASIFNKSIQLVELQRQAMRYLFIAC
jgi:hypothetical protein